jgi:hypothetical protein
MSQIYEDDMPDLPPSWQKGVEVEWDHTGPGKARDLDDPAPVASEVTARREVQDPSTGLMAKRRSPEDSRQEARDNALQMARLALSVLEQSIDWASVEDPGSTEQAKAALDALGGWVRTRAGRIKPAKPVFDLEDQIEASTGRSNR